MWHEFFDQRPWFAPKAYGYGAGMPIAWQGWVLIGCFILSGVRVGLTARSDLGPNGQLGIAALSLAAVGLIVIVKRRTRGGWRWRWGELD